MGYDPNQPRDEIGRWAEVAGASARKAAGLKQTGETLKSLSPELATAAQKVYDDWDQSDPENDDLGGGGICQDIAEVMASKLNEFGIEAQTVSAQIGEQHVWVVAKLADGVYNVDIYPSAYERGGGYSWTKIPGVKFGAEYISISRLDPDPNSFSQYTEGD